MSKNDFTEQMLGRLQIEMVEQIVKNPNTSEKEKVKALCGLGKKLMQDNIPTEVRMMLPLIGPMAVIQAKSQFNALPKEAIVAQIDGALAGKVDRAGLEAQIDDVFAKAAAKSKKSKTLGFTPPANSDDLLDYVDDDQYMFDAKKELSEEEYVAFSVGLGKLAPSRLHDLFTDGDVEAAARESYAVIQNSTDLKSYQSARNLPNLVVDLPEETKEFILAFVDGLSGEKLYGAANDIVEGLDDTQISVIAEKGLGFVEDFLNAGEKGNVLKLDNTDNAVAVRDALSGLLQNVEDAVVNNGLIPQTGFAEAFKQAKAAKQSGGVAPSNPNLKQKGKGNKARGLQPKKR